MTNLSFQAAAGQHTVLQGASGCGKSTILKLLLGFYPLQSGHISIDGTDHHPQSIRRQTAWLPQELDLGSGTVREVLSKPFEFAANSSHAPSLADQQNALQQLGLDAEIPGKPFRDLSTGQRQRVGLALCFLLDKPLLLLDEPTSALDRHSKEQAAALLLKGNRTILSTSHDPFWVEQADHLIELD